MIRPTDEQLDDLSASLLRVQSGGESLAAAFYKILFARHPELRRLLPADIAGQVRKLDETLLFFIENAVALEDLQEPVRRLARLHVDLGVTAKDYLVVEPTLIAALASLRGARLNARELGAWSSVIRQVCTMMMQETDLMTG